MNPPLPRFQAVLAAALQRIKQAGRLAAERSVDSLGLAALSSMNVRERDDLLTTQFEFNKRLAPFIQAFNDSLDKRLQRAIAPPGQTVTSAKLPWEALSLVEDSAVEAQVQADRIAQTLLHECEWELREIDAYIGSLLMLQRHEPEQNPLRPEALALAVIAGTDAVSERPDIRKLLAAEVARALTSLMRTAYGDIVTDLRNAGVQPLGLTLRSAQVRGRAVSGVAAADDSGHASHFDSSSAGFASSGAASSRHGAAGGFRGSSSSSSSSSGTIGQVDAQLMTLIRRLAFLGNVSDSVSGGSADLLPADGGGADDQRPHGPNLIQSHREELRQASTGALDHMVIDVVGSLFEQILADPKVPPQMARQIGRLQLPVLRVALGDVTFFSSRRHPVRRFVNRIASLACAFDDFSEGPGQHFLGLVKDLVQEIVTGDFDQMGLYESKLAALEAFIGQQTDAEVQAQGDAATLLQRKESELLQQQRYMQQLQGALTAVDMQGFLRDFLAQVWSQTLVRAQHRDSNGAMLERMRRAGRDLVMSVQPKGSPAERKQFLLRLPQLMKDLSEGMAMVGWPESARKAFFAELLPAHAESLKRQPMRQLDYNLLVKQLDAILAAPMPGASESVPAGLFDTAPGDDTPLDIDFSAAEVEQVGLLAESAVNWSGSVDIDLGAEPELSEVDINIDGLPPAEPNEPTRGASLAQHVQLGFAYQMHLDDQWQKVRLSYVSPGRAFFVFTSGRKHQKTISLTQRMLNRLCETGRLRAFENAYLIERATARARKQLAAMKTSPARH
jgi:hypothetical protein